MLRSRTAGARAGLASAQAGIRAAWDRGAPRERLVLGVGLAVLAALAGAFLFGVWHVVFGFVVKGNPRAGLFGLVLAAITGALLVGGGIFVRRRLPPA